MGVMKMTKLTNVITLAEYANKHGFDVKRLRRLARNGTWPMTDETVVERDMPFKWGGEHGLWAIDATAPAIELPAKSARGSRRADGRQRYIVFVNTTELTAVKNIVGDDNVIDPRVAAKQRRDTRKQHDAVANRVCPSCGETGDPTCWYGDGVCATENAGWENDADG